MAGVASMRHVNQVTAIPLCRVTVVTPRRRVDLAVPSDLPLSHLLPDLLAATGESAEEVAPAGRLGTPANRAGRPCPRARA